MKSLKEYSMNLSEKDYHAYPAYSYSLIARYAKEGFSAIKNLREPVKQTDSMRFGSLFDAMLTHEGNVENEYVVFERDVPPARKAVLDRIAELSDAKELHNVDDSIIMQALQDCDYKAAKKFETQYEHLAEYADYYKVIKSGKQVVSQQDWDDASDMVNAVMSNDYLKEHFGVSSTADKEFIYQAQLSTVYPTSVCDVKLKCMLDLLEVDHKNKTIQPWDVKTSTCPAFDFADQFVKFRYDIQASLYTDMIRMVMLKDEKYKDYTILPFKFMDVSRSDKQPVAWEYDPSDVSQLDGLFFTSGDRTYQFKDYKKLLDEIVEYEASEAKVPKYISISKPNSIIKMLNKENG